MNSDGFSEFLKALSSQSEGLDRVMVAMESTGCYHINLFSQGIRTVVVNPLLISNFAKLSLRKTKTDKKDALTIARFVLDHPEEISQFSIFQDHQDLRDLSRERESLCHLISATKVEIKRVLRTIFPELESIGNLYTRGMLHFLLQYPSARLVRAAKPKAIAQVSTQNGGRVCYEKTQGENSENPCRLSC
jgi:transposase